MGKIIFLSTLLLFLSGCFLAGVPALAPGPTPSPVNLLAPAAVLPSAEASTATPIPATLTPPPPTATPLPSKTPIPVDLKTIDGIPVFQHIIVIVFENRDYKEYVGSPQAPNFNRLADQNVLLTNYFAVAHPSLPNYLAMIAGNTFGINSDCSSCYLNEKSLPDLLESTGRTWKTYQEDMPSPCYKKFTDSYDLNHDPFVYFDSIRKDAARCSSSVVPLTQLSQDLSANQLPDFAFITPNLCNGGHNCEVSVTDTWLGKMVGELQSSPALGQNYMIFVVLDESNSDNSACCGLDSGGGRVPALLISPRAQSGYQDKTQLSHYSLLKTILLSWGLPGLGLTESPATLPITAPWK